MIMFEHFILRQASRDAGDSQTEGDQVGKPHVTEDRGLRKPWRHSTEAPTSINPPGITPVADRLGRPASDASDDDLE